MQARRALRPIALAAALALGLAACTLGADDERPAPADAVADSGADNGAEVRADFPTPSGAFATGRDAVVEVVDRVLPAVVNVVSTTSGGEGEGTGFIVRSDGIVVTNFHVVQNATDVQVLTSDEDPDRYDARVIGGDVAADLAVLDIDAEDLPTVPLGDSGSLRLGEQVVAIGYALGFAGGPSVTTGIVSSLTRRISVPGCPEQECPNGERVYSHLIQTDAAINPGNSGGPLVDLAGRVVGINTAGVRAASAENVGFAIQIDFARPIILDAADNPNEPVAYLGVQSGDASDAALRFQLQFDPPVERGALIRFVAPGQPADRAGIDVRDVIVGFDGEQIDGWGSLGEAIRSHEPGDRVDVEVVHPDGSRDTLSVTLGVNPVALP
jgi:S1-C subfamily serine protease